MQMSPYFDDFFFKLQKFHDTTERLVPGLEQLPPQLNTKT